MTVAKRCRHPRQHWTRGAADEILLDCDQCASVRPLRKIAGCILDGQVARVDATALAEVAGLEITTSTEWSGEFVEVATWSFAGITRGEWAGWCEANRESIRRVLAGANPRPDARQTDLFAGAS